MRRMLVPVVLVGACVSGPGGVADSSKNAAPQYWVAFAVCLPETEFQLATTNDLPAPNA
jgi:hypothetical protein